MSPAPQSPSQSIVIAVDGTAASGKGTLAKRLARHFGFAHLDSGALYRLAAHSVLQAKGDPSSEADALSKYSHASAITVHLHGSRDQLEVTVADDGRGFDVRQAWGTGLGLVSIEERLDAFHGKLEIESAPGQGTRVHGTVPSAALSHAGGMAS